MAILHERALNEELRLAKPDCETKESALFTSLTVSVVEAWWFASAFFITLLAVKIGWIVFTIIDGGLQLQTWEWLILPLVATPNHLLLALIFFALYTVVLTLGNLTKPTRYIGLAALLAGQTFVIYWNVVSFRIGTYLGVFPTYGIIRAATQGGVAVESLLAPENIIFNTGATVLAIFAALIPFKLRRRFPRLPARRRAVALSVGIALWVGAGTAAGALMPSDPSHAQVDPSLFYLREMIAEGSERDGESQEPPSAGYPRTSLFQDEEAAGRPALSLERSAWRETKRNLVLIVLESMPSSQASFVDPVVVDGEERETTPILSGLREHMLLARNHYTVQPESMTALFSTACSLYPYPARPTITEVAPRIPCQSMSEMLDERGYVSGLFHSGHFEFWFKDRFFRDRGFDVMLDGHSLPGAEDSLTFRWGVDERTTVRAVNDFIREHRDHPFFVQYVPVFPHGPYELPEESLAFFRGEDERVDYHNLVRYVDAAIGSIVDELREQELLEETLIVVVGDHGEAFHEHPGNQSHSQFLYEENVHVPLALINPLLFDEATTIEEVTSHVDILPTIADLLDLPQEPTWQGRNLVGELAPAPVYFFAAHGRQLLGMRDGRWKAIWDRDRGTIALYDLVADPRELQDLSSDHRERIPTYRSALEAWREHQLGLIPHFAATRAEIESRGVTIGALWPPWSP